jgi:acyl-CoA synthetase (AMP-forming)/AMP-acid ligase II
VPMSKTEASPDDPDPWRLRTDVVPEWWYAASESYPDETLILKDKVSYSFREIDTRSAALARGLLAEGATKGSKIGLLAPNGPEWVIAWLAINRIGGLAVFLSTFASAAELGYAVPYADVQILIVSETYLRHDYLARLEEGLPGLAEADGKAPLTLAIAPFLRSAWIIGARRPRWARGSLEDLEARGAASQEYNAALLAAAEAQVSTADAAMLIFTSGTTAFPKAVVHTQGTVVRRSLSGRRAMASPTEIEHGARILLPSPFFWISGMLTLCGAIQRGSCVICLDDHSPRGVFEAIRDYGAKYVSGVASVLTPACAAGGEEGPAVMSQLRPMSSHQMAFFDRLADRPPARLALALGMTETFGPFSGGSNEELPPDLPASVGRVLEGWEWKIVDPQTGRTLPDNEFGELCVRGVFLMDGMYKKERHEVFDADGYYHTGDGCTLRPDGYLVYGNRLSGMIKTSGANVSPEEVEVAIRALPDVVDVCVVGVPDPKLGQMVVAAVVRSPGSTLDEGDVRAQAQARLSSFKAPKRVLFFEYSDLPRTPSHKIRAPALRQMIADMMANEEKV